VNSYEWDELALGLEAEFEVTVTASMMTRFLETTGDENPLHVDDGYARQRGFPRRVVYGLLTASFYSTLAGVYLPGRRCLLHGLKVEFASPVYVGDRLRVHGKIGHRNQAFRQIELVCEITNQRSEVVSRARVRAGIARDDEMETKTRTERRVSA
jgi:acyl dehydratase